VTPWLEVGWQIPHIALVGDLKVQQPQRKRRDYRQQQPKDWLLPRIQHHVPPLAT